MTVWGVVGFGVAEENVRGGGCYGKCGDRLCNVWGKGARGSHLSHLGGRGTVGSRPAKT
jgi:hypothetical protein